MVAVFRYIMIKIKKITKKYLFLILLILLIILWICFGYVAFKEISNPELQCTNNSDKVPKAILDYLNTSYVAAGALFTGFAFVITYSSLRHQKEELQNQNRRLAQQISIDIFSDAFGHVLDVDRFREAKKYIYSNQFKEAVDELVSRKSPSIKYLINKANAEFEEKKDSIRNCDNKDNIDEKISIERKGHNNILLGIRKSYDYNSTMENLCIDDFKEIKSPVIYTNDKENESYPDKDKTKDVSAYQMILYFCDRMEYLGVIYNTYSNSTEKDNINRNLILDYFGFDIIHAFEILRPFIFANRKENNKGNPYYKFELLYLFAVNRRNEYIQECETELKKLNSAIKNITKTI